MMKKVVVKRIQQLPEGMFGVMLIDGKPMALTLERRWNNNKKGESCIPAGCYSIQRIQSPKFGATFEVKNVPERDAILFHSGNIDDDSHGCIILGAQFGIWTEDRSCCLIHSKSAFLTFMSYLIDVNEAMLEIFNCYE